MTSAVLLGFLLLAAAQDKVTLELKAKQGDRYTFTLTEATEGKVEIAGQEIPIKEREVLKYKDEVLEVEGKAPMRVRRTVVEWSTAKQEDPAAPAEKTARGLQGKTIVLKKAGDQTEYEGAAGVSEGELKKHQLRPEAYLSNLPKGAVAVGHGWELDAKRLLEEFRDGEEEEEPVEVTSAKGTAKLTGIEEHKGVRCGVITVEVTGKGGVKEQDDIAIQFKLQARLYLALESGRLLWMTGSGSGDIKGTIDMGGEKAQVGGTFQFTLEGEAVYE